MHTRNLAVTWHINFFRVCFIYLVYHLVKSRQRQYSQLFYYCTTDDTIRYDTIHLRALKS